MGTADVTHGEVLNAMDREMHNIGLKQRPMLSSSHPVRNDDLFSLTPQQDALRPLPRRRAGDYLNPYMDYITCDSYVKKYAAPLSPQRPPPQQRQQPEVLYLRIVRGENLIARDIRTSDPYVDIACENYKPIAKTKVQVSNLNPIWDEQFSFEVPSNVRYITLSVWDSDNIGNDDFMGAAYVNTTHRVSGKQLLPLGARRGNQNDDKLLKKHKGNLGKIDIFVEWRPSAEPNVVLRRLALQ
jgi:hypothetical protein